jgi:uncharacterized protein (TIGR02246 family)
LTDSIDPTDRDAVAAIVTNLEAAWNASDGTRFGTQFSDDADFVTIRAEHFRRREAIARGHDAIFRTIYAGSINRYALEGVRLLRPDVALVHVRAVLDVPSGPLAGRHSATFSAVLTREADGWRIASLHNTLAPSGGGGPAAQ